MWPFSAMSHPRQPSSSYAKRAACINTRHGQQSLGLRSITFNVGSIAELDRIESALRSQDHFTDRRRIDDGASELLRGRDPDNLPLVFVSYATDTVGPEYYRSIVNLIYSMDA